MWPVLDQRMGLLLGHGCFLKRLSSLLFHVLVLAMLQQAHLASIANHDFDRLVVDLVEDALAKLLPHVRHVDILASLHLLNLPACGAIDDHLSTLG